MHVCAMIHKISPFPTSDKVRRSPGRSPTSRGNPEVCIRVCGSGDEIVHLVRLMCPNGEAGERFDIIIPTVPHKV